jgi:hypothetical protein
MRATTAIVIVRREGTVSSHFVPRRQHLPSTTQQQHDHHDSWRRPWRQRQRHDTPCQTGGKERASIIVDPPYGPVPVRLQTKIVEGRFFGESLTSHFTLTITRRNFANLIGEFGQPIATHSSTCLQQETLPAITFVGRVALPKHVN